MATSPPKEVYFGCDNQVRLVITEDDGNLLFQIYAEDPENIDIDALFFNLTDDADVSRLVASPEFSEEIGSNGENITDFDADLNGFNQMDNSAQVRENFDVRVEFGTVPYTSGGDVNEAALTFYLDGGNSDLTIDSIDLSNMTVVVNTDGVTGTALVSNAGSTPAPVEVVALSEDFSGSSLNASGNIAHNDGWYLNSHTGKAVTNGCYDGRLVFDEVATDGPVSLTFDAQAGDLTKFEAGGWYGDSFRVEVQIDGGDWVLLDEFVVNHDATAMVGSKTGQTIGSGEASTLTYSGGLLDDTNGDVQFRVVSDFTSSNETMSIDNVEITTTEAPAGVETTVETVVAEENFDGLHYATQSGEVRWNEGWDVENGALSTDGCNDGNLWFESVEIEGEASVSFDARAPHVENFDAGGYYGDSLEVWALVNGTEWHLLDTYVVNADGTALVGDKTGQTITTDTQTLTYEGGALAGADTVQIVLDSDISARNEEIIIDNYVVTDTVVTDGAAETCEEFEDAHAGDVVSDQFDGFTVSGQRAGDDPDSENDAMIFDTSNPTGYDWDLHYANQGNAIIISEDNDSHDPDDNAGGGTLTFEFDQVSDVTSLTVLDVEEAGGSIDLYDAEGELINSVAIPEGENNSLQVIEVNTNGVASMDVNLAGSGAVDDVCFSVAQEQDDTCLEYEVTYDDWMTDKELEEEEPAAEEEDELAMAGM
ncbi:hypothetical protein ACOXXX_00955 [Thalassococcus sp. BH17M4-6]|uniref:hypothetical protein n=1 Tax=Thalassococcus sp. BH17M4-6 TaxID=3413148 RepID=UPI003BD07442